MAPDLWKRRPGAFLCGLPGGRGRGLPSGRHPDRHPEDLPAALSGVDQLLVGGLRALLSSGRAREPGPYSRSPAAPTRNGRTVPSGSTGTKRRRRRCVSPSPDRTVPVHADAPARRGRGPPRRPHRAVRRRRVAPVAAMSPSVSGIRPSSRRGRAGARAASRVAYAHHVVPSPVRSRGVRPVIRRPAIRNRVCAIWRRRMPTRAIGHGYRDSTGGRGGIP